MVQTAGSFHSIGWSHVWWSFPCWKRSGFKPGSILPPDSCINCPMTNRRLKPDRPGAVAIFPPVFLETGAHGGCCPLKGKQPPPQICEARRHVNISPWILPYESNHRVQSLGQGTGSSEKYVMTAPFGPWWERPKLKSPPPQLSSERATTASNLMAKVPGQVRNMWWQRHLAPGGKGRN